MKHIYTSLIFAIGSALPVVAQETTTMIVGYCGDTSDDAIGLYEKDVNVAAVEFSGDFLTQYAGNRVKSVVFQLGASFGSVGTIFVTDELTAPLPEAYPGEFPIPEFDTAPCYQWLEAPLPEPFEIQPDHPFFVGIRILPYTQAPYYGTWMFAVEENAAAASHSYLYDAGKGVWKHPSDYSFEDLTAPNHLIKLCLEGSSLPTNDIAVSDLNAIEYMRTSESCTCTFNITNLASNEVLNYDAELILDGAVAQSLHIDLAEPLKTNGTVTGTFDNITFANEGTHTVGVRVKSVNGVADTHPENNTSEREISVIDTYFDHTVLYEAFTTMSCANCPYAHEYQNEAFKDAERVVRVDHHSGFGTDILTTKTDEDFLWFYNNNGTVYAPGLMIDRIMIDDIFDPQRSPGEEHTPVVGGSIFPQDLRNIHSTLTDRPAWINVNIDAQYNKETRKLDVTVSGEAIAKLKGNNPVINVWLTESGLSAADNPRYGQMTGSGRPDMTFVHDHAMRATLTGSWGKALNVGIAPYSSTFSTTLADGWKPENMEIVAFISNYDSADPTNCMVHNAAALPFRAFLDNDADAVVSIEVAPKHATPSYDLSGRTVSGTVSGVIIANGRKIVR